MTAQRSPWSLGLAGACATLIGIGLARFAYTPMIPALVQAHWFSASAANYLGAANLFGYLLGAVSAHGLSERWGTRRVMGASLLLTIVSFFACAEPWGLGWYLAWRGLAGVTGAVLMVVAAPSALARVDARHRPRVSALVFTGIGVGVIFAGTVVPWLAQRSVATAWIALGALAAALALASWPVWRSLAPLESETQNSRRISRAMPVLAVSLLVAVYTFDAIGFVPHTVFWVDFIARQLGRGLAAGGHDWTLFGVGAACGPLLAGALAARTGFRGGLLAAVTVKAAAVALPLASVTASALAASSLAVGALVPGVVALSSGCVAELVPAARQKQVWGWMTTMFALAQTVAGYGMSWLYDQIGTYLPLFAIGAGSLLLGALCALALVSLSPLAPMRVR